MARDLGIESWVANGLETTSSGRLAGTGIGRVDPSRKDVAYLGLLRRLGIRRENTIAVGDTVYDLRFLKSARMGFFLTEKGKVPDASLIPIGRLTDIFRHLEREGLDSFSGREARVFGRATPDDNGHCNLTERVVQVIGRLQLAHLVLSFYEKFNDPS